ncbi:alpha/beta fold hydrolase [Ferrimonas sp. SCSIO 43195]|uniref:alpha/beta fold hydrolase n=1 Tax=Ferrimonas sp. SCSIO 43195 TaxID=2822844 RepID=UPI002075D3F3|nr:alpha/beta hydrolase [Ferrimonas sp. SCSIO 43195]USD39211.1 alpha/beta fold hydrolase [Ferrimonas sp. SCSIO 43195]
MALLPAPEETYFALDSIELAGLRWGDPNAPLVVALHGWLDNGNSFAPLAPHLVAAGYQLLALEFPGHGHSQNRHQGNYYHFLDYLYELHQLWPQLPRRPVLVLGHSMGGIIASLFAALYPQQVARLMVVEAMGPLTAAPEQTLEKMRQGFASRDKPTSQASYRDIDALVTARAKAGQFDLETARLLLQRNLHQQPDGRWCWRSDPRLRMRSPWMMTDAQAQNLMQGLMTPTCFVLGQGGFDELRSAWQARRHWFADARLELIEGGHHCHMQQPQQLLRLILQFIDVKSSEHTGLD